MYERIKKRLSSKGLNTPLSAENEEGEQQDDTGDLML